MIARAQLPLSPPPPRPAGLAFTLPAPAPFSLDPVAKLGCGFLRGTRACGLGEVKLAFPLDGSFALTGVSLKHEGDTLVGELYGSDDVAAAKRQVARILALDHDATGFAQVLENDPVLKRVAAERPGFRPVVSYSPYVMAGWAVLSQRLRMSQAAAIQVKLAEETGDLVSVAGESVASFPRPRSLLKVKRFASLQPEKLTRLHAIAEAALDGRLELDALTSVPYAQAREQLMTIRGVGPWTADAVLMRGCGPTDLLPLSEPTLYGAVAEAYGLKQLPDDAAVERIAQSWAPFRMWVSVLLISGHFDAAKARVKSAKR
jgi:DNA-3-methyladenine glycosylase II